MNFDFPVGLIRSPIITGFFPISTAWAKEDTTVRCFLITGTGVFALHRSYTFRICSGVVPQQPPAIRAPISTISSIIAANSSASISYTVFPFSLRGRPALGLTITGIEETARSSFKISLICAGPRPQFIPRTSTPSPSSIAATEAGLPPVSSFPLSSKVTVTNTGRLQASFAASTAAFVS